jgi:hypothetical protein
MEVGAVCRRFPQGYCCLSSALLSTSRNYASSVLALYFDQACRRFSPALDIRMMEQAKCARV